MKISYQLLSNKSIDSSNLSVVIIANLHTQKKISDVKMKAMIKSLREGKLLRRINTYKCKINNKWYDNENMFTILEEAYNQLCIKQDIELKDFLPYVSLLLNKNKNFCIDWVFFELINPLFNNIEYNIKQIRSFGIDGLNDSFLTFEEADYKFDLLSGYCCEDCDGDEEEYKMNKYQYHHERHYKDEMNKLFRNYLFQEKTKDAIRNPFERLLSNYKKTYSI